MAERALVPILKTYAELRQAVEATLVRGQREIERAKRETYWRTGALIDRHLSDHEDETGYGTKTMRRLAADLKFEQTVLYRCLRLARVYPNFAARRNLLWGHYRVLIDVADPSERRALEVEADRMNWTTKVLEGRVRALNTVEVTPAKGDRPGETTPAHKPLVPKRGTPGLHLIVEKSIGLSVDLGFRHYWPLSPEPFDAAQGRQAKRFAKGDIVRIANDDSLQLAADATKAQLFTYTARPVRVVDGDTLVVALEVSPGVFIEQKLRLRDLDCPEMDTPAGKAAKRFTESLVNSAKSITISTTKPDKYDRYLADVFIQTFAGDAPFEASAKEGEIFLNNALLENGHAVVKKAWEFGDWGLAG